ncbi:MAG: hypothetical protein ACPGOY_18955 [Rhodospirillaceae bacterium]
MARAAVRSASVPPPVGGWNARDALAEMPASDAVILENWFPGTDSVKLRRGYASHATGLGGAVESLVPYVDTNGNASLFAAAGGAIYDVTNPGSVGAAVVSGMTNNRWQCVQSSNIAATANLIMCNGQDTPRLYDGSTWSTASITGPSSPPIWCNVHQRRLWLGEQNSLNAYYLGFDAIAGTATPFYLGGIARMGGYIMAMGTWTRDGGDGADDVAVFLTSEGEAIVYQGTDPASNWSLIGVFRVGRPIGRRCMVKMGADLIMITEDGFVAATTLLALDRSQTEAVAISAKINDAVNQAVRLYGGNFGWEPFVYPKGTQMIFNVPKSGTEADQYVFNTITRAACKFTNLPALCWGLRGDTAFFGDGAGTVWQFDVGDTDNGAAVIGDAVQAFSAFRSPGQDKAFKRVEVVFKSVADPEAAVEINTDFEVTTFTAVTTQQATGAALWDDTQWDVGLWGDEQVWKGWRSVRGHGRYGSLRLRSSTTVGRPEWLVTNWMFTTGGTL